jgi:hypothetical protein
MAGCGPPPARSRAWQYRILTLRCQDLSSASQRRPMCGSWRLARSKLILLPRSGTTSRRTEGECPFRSRVSFHGEEIMPQSKAQECSILSRPVATGIAHLLAGIAILSGVLAVLASRLLTAMITIFGARVWARSLSRILVYTWCGTATRSTWR